MSKPCPFSLRVCMIWLLSSIAFALPTHAQTVSEGPDHATQVLGNAWDMAAQDDVFPLLWTHNLASAVVANGTMTGTARDTDPHFWLQFPRIPSAMPATNLAQPAIDAGHYTHLAFMMWLPDTIVPGSRNGRLVWHKGGATVAAFDAAYSESPQFPVYPGWHLYHFDLASMQPASGTSWAGSIQGLRLDPCLGCNVAFKIDWARLFHHNEATSSASLAPGKTHLLVQATPTGATQAVTTSLFTSLNKASVASLPPGQYRAAPITDGDYALSQRGKAWTLDTRSDLLWASNNGIAAAQTGPSGLSGTTSNGDPFVLLDIAQQAPIDTSKYRHIAIDLTLDQLPAQEPGLLVWWGDHAATVRHPSSFTPVQAGRATYHVDLGQSPQWSGWVKALRIDPLNGPNAGSGIKFTIHSIRLTQASGYEEAVAFNPEPLIVNARPTVSIVSPGLEDGEDYALVEQGRSWSMQSGQVQQPQLSNLRTWSYTDRISELNLAGTFFQGTSQPAAANQTEGDPHVFLTFQENTHPVDANTYRWFGFDLYVPMDATQQSELTLGAVARLAWKAGDTDPGVTTDDIVLMPGLQRYWFDMNDLVYEPSTARTWNGPVRYLRVDPFEFPESRSFHMGSAQLRSTPSARYVWPVLLQLHDADGDPLSVRIKSGDTLLGTASNLAAGTHQIVANLAALPPGEHTLTVEVSDGHSTVQRSASIPIIKPTAQSPLPAHQIKAADRIFNWAENLLRSTVGAGSASSSSHACLQAIPGAYGRTYAASGICLFTIDGLILFTIHGDGLSLAGTTSQLLVQAAAAGY